MITNLLRNLDLPDTADIVVRNVLTHFSVWAVTLSQVGYELQPPRPSLGIDFYLFYPRPQDLFRFVVQRYGYRGFFSGVLERIVTDYLSILIDFAIMRRHRRMRHVISEYWDDIIRFALSRLITAAVIHPLRVITVRKMLQVVGGESAYSNPLSAVLEIYRHEGLPGFYSGLTPYLVYGAVSCVLMALIDRYIDSGRTYYFGDARISGWSIAASYSMYPLQAVTTVMMANGARLQVVQDTMESPYLTWMDCLVDLMAKKRIFRGVYTI